jgi:hypothetical protein
MAATERVTLPDYEGLPVRRVAMKITNAGDGLSDSLKLEPILLHHNDEVFVVLRGFVVDVQHPPADKSEPGEIDAVVKTYKVKAAEIAIVEHGDVDALLERNRERLGEKRKLQERLEAEQRAAEGAEMRLPGTEDTAAVLEAEHADGDHASGLVDGCPRCIAEAEAVAAETPAPKRGRKR